MLKEISGTKIEPIYAPSRAGDIPHSLADISKAKKLIGYIPTIKVEEGLKQTFNWFKNNL